MTRSGGIYENPMQQVCIDLIFSRARSPNASMAAFASLNVLLALKPDTEPGLENLTKLLAIALLGQPTIEFLKKHSFKLLPERFRRR